MIVISRDLFRPFLGFVGLDPVTPFLRSHADRIRRSGDKGSTPPFFRCAPKLPPWEECCWRCEAPPDLHLPRYYRGLIVLGCWTSASTSGIVVVVLSHSMSEYHAGVWTQLAEPRICYAVSNPMSMCLVGVHKKGMCDQAFLYNQADHFTSSHKCN